MTDRVAVLTGADGGLVFDGPQGEVESISVEPATTTIDVVNGTSTPAQFKAVGKLKTGGTTTVPATWAFDRLDLAVISAGGSLKAHGSKGGTGTVTATFGLGQAMGAAVDHGAERVVSGLGGWGANDGGAGMLAALALARRYAEARAAGGIR